VFRLRRTRRRRWRSTWGRYPSRPEFQVGLVGREVRAVHRRRVVHRVRVGLWVLLVRAVRPCQALQVVQLVRVVQHLRPLRALQGWLARSVRGLQHHRVVQVVRPLRAGREVPWVQVRRVEHRYRAFRHLQVVLGRQPIQVVQVGQGDLEGKVCMVVA